MDISEALATLDVENDEQWTADGLPKVDVVADLVDNDKLKRADILDAAPDFNRESTTKPDDSEADSEDDEEEVAAALSPEDQCRAEFDATQLELNGIAQEINALNEARQDLERKISYLGGQLERFKAQNPGDNSDITRYLASQRQLRLEKAARLAALNEVGIGEILKSVSPSALDSAMKRRKASPSGVRREYPHSIKS